MAGLPKTIIKKYGVSKKAWAVYKSKKNKKSSSSRLPRKKIKRRVKTMPKKKRRTSRNKRSISILGINLGKAGAAALYGAGRAKISNLLAPYTSKIPLGVISDEVGMVIALQLAKKYVIKKAGILRDAATFGQAIEFARIGEAAATGQLNLGILGGQQAQTNGNLF